MTYQPSEVADLVLMLAFGPVIVVSLRRGLKVVPVSCYVALGAMLGAYFFTVAEGFVLPDLFNLLEHVCYAVAGIAFVGVVIQFGRIAPPTGASRDEQPRSSPSTSSARSRSSSAGVMAARLWV